MAETSSVPPLPARMTPPSSGLTATPLALGKDPKRLVRGRMRARLRRALEAVAGERLHDLPHDPPRGEVDEGDLPAAVLEARRLGRGHDEMLSVGRQREADRPGRAGLDEIDERVRRAAIRRIERLRHVEHGDEAGMAVLERRRRLRRRAPRMVDHIGEAPVGRDDEIDRLPARRRARPPRPAVDVRRHARPADDRRRRAARPRFQRGRHVDDGHDIVPASAHEQVRPPHTHSPAGNVLS